ncbi:MAG: beta-lactamase family protein [Alphaproteobacteria bacterium]|nr:beta-lactamase family protein [Alphaproteobacteria bacterium]MBL6936887.1 beta-lactamase family protein [Alphaproteobacteria bacterium]MBL7097656.1 beta-lactamase family protein [Alphaproteobacteria bacterium]
MWKPRIVLVALLLQVPLAAAAGESVRTPLDADVPRLLAAYAVPSVSIARIRGGRLVLTAAYGSQSAGVPATTATLYNIASLTKPLTAEIVLRLMSEGAFSLDEPMYRTWTDPDIAGDEWRKELTPRIALSHQTGFPNWRDPVRGLKFLNEPGRKYAYSGEGYEYLARFVEKRTDQDFETLAQTHLFSPTGMIDTAYTGKPWFEGRIAVPTDATGHPLKPRIATHYSAADLVYTTSSDYAAFMIEVLKNRDLTPELAEERSRPQVSMMDTKCLGSKAATCPLFTGFGLGWQILVFPDAKLMIHTGRDDGVYTFAYLDRSSGDGAVILTNGESGDKLVVPILQHLHARAEFIRYLKGQEQ